FLSADGALSAAAVGAIGLEFEISHVGGACLAAFSGGERLAEIKEDLGSHSFDLRGFSERLFRFFAAIEREERAPLEKEPLLAVLLEEPCGLERFFGPLKYFERGPHLPGADERPGITESADRRLRIKLHARFEDRSRATHLPFGLKRFAIKRKERNELSACARSSLDEIPKGRLDELDELRVAAFAIKELGAKFENIGEMFAGECVERLMRLGVIFSLGGGLRDEAKRAFGL